MLTSPSLLELQRGFAAAIVDGDTRLAAYIDARAIAPAARLRIYRNAVFAIQVEALETSFPAVRRLLGEECFDGLATRYAARHGSRSGNLQDFGATFAVFLSAQAEVAAFSWVGAVAELEWLRQECALAAGWPRADAQALTAALLAGLQLRVQPHVRVLSAQVPALDLWRHAMESEARTVDPAGGAQHVLLWREDAAVVMREIGASQAAFVRALRDSGNMEAAWSAANLVDPSAQAEGLLSGLLEHALLVP